MNLCICPPHRRRLKKVVYIRKRKVKVVKPKTVRRRRKRRGIRGVKEARTKLVRPSRDKSLPFTTTYPFYVKSTYDTGNGVAVPYVPETSGAVSIGNNAVVRVKDPNWKVKVAKRIDATNPYKITKWIATKPATISGRGLFEVGGGFPPYKTRCYTRLLRPATLPSPLDDSVRELALKKLKKKLSDNIGLYNSIVPIVELRELRKGCESLVNSAMVFGTALLGSGRVRAYKRKPMSLLSELGDAWLQWSFGIKPLLKDIENANESIGKILTSDDHTVTLTGSAKRFFQSSQIVPAASGLYGASVTDNIFGSHVIRYRYNAAFDLKIRSSNDYSAQNVLGLDWDSIPSTVWELTPYSWLIDYFTSMGDYFDDTFEVPSGSLTYINLSRTSRSRFNHELSFNTSDPRVSILESKMLRGQSDYIDFERTKLTALPRLALRFKTVDEIGKNGVNKLLNLLSISMLRYEKGEIHSRSRIRNG